VVSYLPLSHVAAQITDIFHPLAYACNVYFADSDALKGSLVKTLRSVKPTFFVGVPRVFEKMQEQMMSIGATSGPLKKIMSKWAKNAALRHYSSENDLSSNFGYRLAKNLIFSRVKKALGFERCKIIISAGAPTSVDIKKYFLSLDMPLCEGYGMSEAGGAHVATFVTGTFQFHTVGTSLLGTETKILSSDGNREGEV
jgi:long-chain-fatty-acid--CoA ligase ACSBG